MDQEDESQHDTPDSLRKDRDIEIDQQTDARAGHPQIANHLSDVNGEDPLN